MLRRSDKPDATRSECSPAPVYATEYEEKRLLEAEESFHSFLLCLLSRHWQHFKVATGRKSIDVNGASHLADKYSCDLMLLVWLSEVCNSCQNSEHNH